jgi:hypothetical protein
MYENLKLVNHTAGDFRVENGEAVAAVAEAPAKKPKVVYIPRLSKEEDMRMRWISLFTEARSIWVYILRIWLRVNGEESTLDGGIASFVVEAAIAWFGNQEQEFYREAYQLESTLLLQMESEEDELLHLALITLRDVANVRKSRRTSYMLPIKPLDVRHPGMTKATSIINDTIIVQWMSDLYVESVGTLLLGNSYSVLN